MKRRQMLVAGGLAAVSTVAFGGETVTSTIAKAALAAGAGAPACVLLPIEVSQRATGAPISLLQISKFWAGEAATGVARWDFDLRVYDAAGLPQAVFAWQLRRHGANGAAMASSGVRMRFPEGVRLDLAATVLGTTGKAQVFDAGMPSGSLMVLATTRRLTGRPPALTDLRYNPVGMQLTMADGSRRDFDALLLRTT
jgi:hypothetical protein